MTGVATDDVRLGRLVRVLVFAFRRITYWDYLHEYDILAVVLHGFTIVCHLDLLVVLLLLDEVLELVNLLILAVVRREAIPELGSYVPIKDQVMRQVEEEESLEDGDVLAGENPALLEVVDEVRAVLSLILPFPIGQAEDSEYLACKRLFHAGVYGTIGLSFSRVEQLFDPIHDLLVRRLVSRSLLGLLGWGFVLPADGLVVLAVLDSQTLRLVRSLLDYGTLVVEEGV